MKKIILTPDNNHWDWFISRLFGPEGCHFRGTNESPIGAFECDNSFRFSREILTRMTRLAEQNPSFNIDVEGTLQWFCDNGGYCDCEVVLNLGL